MMSNDPHAADDLTRRDPMAPCADLTSFTRTGYPFRGTKLYMLW